MMAPRKGLTSLILPRDTAETPGDDPAAPHSPLLDTEETPGDDPAAPDTSMDLPQNIGDRDPECAPPDLCPDPARVLRSRRPGEGRFWRSQCVKCQRCRHLVLVGGLIIIGGVIGFFAGHFSAPHPPSCPNKWTRSDDKCFFISQDTNTWDHSLESCRSEGGGGTLLTTDEETLQEIKTLHDLSGDYWVGLRKDSHSGEWRQTDGSNYTKPIEHDGLHMNCAYIGSMKYSALDCASRRHWICVKSLRQDQ